MFPSIAVFFSLCCYLAAQSAATSLHFPRDQPDTNKTAIVVLDGDNNPMPVLEARLELSYFEGENATLSKRSDDDGWLTEVIALPFDTSLDKLYNNDTMESQLAPRANMNECIYWLVGAGQCAYEYWDIADGVWSLGFDIYRMTSVGGCKVVMGNHGAFYYKYYPLNGDCSSTIQQKTIAGAIQAAIRKLEGDWLCNIYLFHVDHSGTWQGDIIIGAGVKVWTASVSSTTYKGCLSEGCSGLQAPYNCNSG